MFDLREWFRMHWALAVDSCWVVAAALIVVSTAAALALKTPIPPIFAAWSLACFLGGHLRGSIAMDTALEDADVPGPEES